MEPRRNGKYEQANNKYWNGNYDLKTPNIDGGGIGWEDHFLPHKFIQRTFEHWVNSIKQLLNAGRGHQASRTVSHCLQKEVGKNRKDKKGDKRGRDGDPSQEGSLKKERSMQIPGNTLTGKSVASLGTSEGNISSAQSLSRVRLFATPWIAARQAPMSISLRYACNNSSSLSLVTSWT